MKNKEIKYFNRELTWIDFNMRVLEEAKDLKNPLFERLKFEAIVSSNLDEFFMVRVASLENLKESGYNDRDSSGLTTDECIEKISQKTHELVNFQYQCFREKLVPDMENAGFKRLMYESLDDQQKDRVEDIWDELFPVITPMLVDETRPFPFIRDKSIYIAMAFESQKEGELLFGTVEIPDIVDRIVEVPSEGSPFCFVLLEDIIKAHVKELFGREPLGKWCFRVTKNAEYYLKDDGEEDLLSSISKKISERKWGNVLRIEYEEGIDNFVRDLMIEEFKVDETCFYPIDGPLDLTFLFKISGKEGFESLKYPSFIPMQSSVFSRQKDIFKAIKEKDILLHHPYDSFEPVISFIEQAADDPRVLAIKQTLYRVSGDSPIVKALARAAENGKQVTVLIELRARFDEKRNIKWAETLEDAGCHVIYGVAGLKTHCKLLLVVRREEDGIKRYVHLSTGNYNDVTAKIYTDLGLFTSDYRIGTDASAIFNMLTGRTGILDLNMLVIAPTHMRQTFTELIKKETVNAKEGKPAKIFAKINALVDTEIIDLLYEASCNGVKTDLMVRGMCCLIPGVPDMSANIRVKSIVGRFLEHSRIFYFYNNGDEKYFISSADWMERNLDRRVETLIPVENLDMKKKLEKIIENHMKDNVKARLLKSDGVYIRPKVKEREKFNSHEYFCQRAGKAKKTQKSKEPLKGFTPVKSSREKEE